MECWRTEEIARVYGQKNSGKKHELVERVNGLSKLNLKLILKWTGDIGTMQNQV